MKEFILRQFDRLARRAALQSPTTLRTRGGSFNILEVAFLKAAYETVQYCEEHFGQLAAFPSDLELIKEAASQAGQSGLFLEFGVATGRTIRHLAKYRPTEIFGFDSFEGLPEYWRPGYDKGAFAGDLPQVPSNVFLVKGWFNQTLPEFLASHSEMVSFIHIDCDLYSSTKCIFDLLGDRIRAGTVILFDEYWNYPGWQMHEFKAFEELKKSKRLKCRPIGFVPSHQQVAFIVDELSSIAVEDHRPTSDTSSHS